MRIGLDGIPLANLLTGIGHYTFELAQALSRLSPSDEFELISPFPFHREFRAAGLPANLRAREARSGRLLNRRWWTVGLPLEMKRTRYTLFHGTNYDVPLWSDCPRVVTIHDLSVLLFPEMHERKVVRRARRRLPIMARRAEAVITATEAGRREVCEHLKLEPERVFVTPYAPRKAFRPVDRAQSEEVRRRLRIEDRFLLFVGTIEPRKNLVTLVRAFEETLRSTDLRPQLVIAGREGWLTEELFSYIERAEFGERLRFTGYLTEEELAALYSSCDLFIYPSLYEGFGLPPLEAMACGAPVITSRTESIAEVVHGGARLVEPTDPTSLARAIIELLRNEPQRERLRLAGRERAAQFSWERTARQTLAVYHQAIARSKLKGMKN